MIHLELFQFFRKNAIISMWYCRLQISKVREFIKTIIVIIFKWFFNVEFDQPKRPIKTNDVGASFKSKRNTINWIIKWEGERKRRQKNPNFNLWLQQSTWKNLFEIWECNTKLVFFSVSASMMLKDDLSIVSTYLSKSLLTLSFTWQRYQVS